MKNGDPPPPEHSEYLSNLFAKFQGTNSAEIIYKSVKASKLLIILKIFIFFLDLQRGSSEGRGVEKLTDSKGILSMDTTPNHEVSTSFANINGTCVDKQRIKRSKWTDFLNPNHRGGGWVIFEYIIGLSISQQLAEKRFQVFDFLPPYINSSKDGPTLIWTAGLSK